MAFFTSAANKGTRLKNTIEALNYFREAIAELALVPQRDTTQTKLWQLASAAARELGRRQNGDTGSPGCFERVVIYHLVAITLLQRHIELLDEKRTSGQRFSTDERRTSRLLERVLDVLGEGIADMSTRLKQPFIPRDKLARKIWFNFYELTVADVEADAAAIVDALPALYK